MCEVLYVGLPWWHCERSALLLVSALRYVLVEQAPFCSENLMSAPTLLQLLCS